MKPLEERKAQRAEQKKNEAKERETVVPKEQEPVQSGPGGEPHRHTMSETLSKQFDADKVLSGKPDEIKGQLSKLNGDQLAQLEAKEKEGKKRTGVLDAIKKQREDNEAAANSWSSGK